MTQNETTMIEKDPLTTRALERAELEQVEGGSRPMEALSCRFSVENPTTFTLNDAMTARA
jgi:hypothetical protein